MTSRSRLFFALWPEATVSQQLWSLTRLDAKKAGRPVNLQNIHLTLAFIGSVDSTMRTCMVKAAEKVRGTPFDIKIDQLGYWRHPRVRWAGCSETPVELPQLVECLNKELMHCGYEPEERAFVPHVTLMRKSRALCEEINFEPVSWHVNDFCLVQSLTQQQGVEYKVVARWPLHI